MTEREQMVREQIAWQFYNAEALTGDMSWSQAKAARTVTANLAYAKADQILDLTDSEGNRLLRIKGLSKVVCLCGSTRFTEQMLVKQWELTKQGHIVLSWCALPDSYFQSGDKTHVGDQEGVKELVDEVHLRKIDLADEVFVLNVGGYIGHSTRREIEYAQRTNKPVEYLEALR